MRWLVNGRLAGETLGAMHTVQSYAREDYEATRFADAVAQALGAARRRIRGQALLTAVVIVLFFGAITAIVLNVLLNPQRPQGEALAQGAEVTD